MFGFAGFTDTSAGWLFVLVAAVTSNKVRQPEPAIIFVSVLSVNSPEVKKKNLFQSIQVLQIVCAKSLCGVDLPFDGELKGFITDIKQYHFQQEVVLLPEAMDEFGETDRK